MTELLLERMVHGGVALARVAGGRLVLVRGGIPGETVRGRVEESSGVLRAEAEEVVERSPDRLPAVVHPGLDLSYIRYPRQLALKREVVVDALRRALPHGVDLPSVEEVQRSPSIWRYRSVVQPVVTGDGLGYRRPGSGDAVQLADDPVANQAVARVWKDISARPIPKGVREIVIRGNDQGQVLLALIATSPQRTLLPYAHDSIRAGVDGVSYARWDARGRFRGGSERLAGNRRIGQVYGDFEMSVSAQSFAQPNPEAASLLYREAARLGGEGTAAVELFAGSGVIALHLASCFQRVEAVEIDRGSVARGNEDALRLGVDNVVFRAEDARRAEIPSDAQLIAVDPPRSGLGREIRDRIESSRANSLLYVSCEPATWARDVSDFVGKGWKVSYARPYDFYPHTHHIEVLSLLVR